MKAAKEHEEYTALLGDNVRRHRLSRRLSQEKLAQRLPVSRDTIRAIETGKSWPQAATLISLTEALGVSLWDVVPSKPNGKSFEPAPRRTGDLRAVS